MAALSPLITWEVRSTGSDTQCGGGFKTGASGKDYTYGADEGGNAAEFSGTDLVVDATTNTKVTSATHNFGADDVGNVIQITAGTDFTVGFYEIVSCASNAATLNASPAAVGKTGGTWWEGGALASPGKAAGAMVAGNDLWIKAGTYTLGTNTANIATGPMTIPGGASGDITWVRGYTTARGDESTKPVISGGTRTGITGIVLCGGAFCRIENISVQGTQDGTAAENTCYYTGNNANIIFYNCIASKGLIGFNITSGSSTIKCIATTCTTQGFLSTGYIVDCRATANVGYGFFFNISSPSMIVNSIADGNSAAGFTFYNYNPVVAINCISVNNTGATGYGFNAELGTQARQGVFINCIAHGNGATGFYVSTAAKTHLRLLNCAAGGNTSAQFSTNISAESQTSSVTLTGDPFTNAAAGDFSLNNTAGAGASCRAAGIGPVGQSSFLDIGACQHKDSLLLLLKP